MRIRNMIYFIMILAGIQGVTGWFGHINDTSLLSGTLRIISGVIFLTGLMLFLDENYEIKNPVNR